MAKSDILGEAADNLNPKKLVRLGSVDKKKVAVAKKLEREQRKAGLFMGIQRPFTTPQPMSHLQERYTSYADGSNYTSGVADIPIYFQVMNQQNGGVLYWPTTLRERLGWFRYFARSEAYVARALEILSYLPLNKIVLNMPKLENVPKETREEIYDFYKAQCDHLNLFEKLVQILYEYNLCGNVFVFGEFSEEKQWWNSLAILPPEEVRVFHKPFSDQVQIEYRPEHLVQMLKTEISGPYNQTIVDSEKSLEELLSSVPQAVIDRIRDQGSIGFDNDPMSGSFIYHFARNRLAYEDLGVSVLERVLVPMLVKEHYRYTQMSLASRNMTPKNKICAPGLNENQLDDLRNQIDLSYMDPDFSVVTNYDFSWENLGAEGRILPLDSEYDRIENQIFAGLGVTREIITGEGTFGGNRITIEILNNMFLIVRDMIQTYVEKYLFRPIAEKRGWFSQDRNGIKKYWYPKIGFNRITLRDNQEVFEALFQLYQKGSIPVDTIYELFNLDSEGMHDKIYNDLFTVKDSTYNNLAQRMNEGVAEKVLENTDFPERVAKYLGLKWTKKPEEGEVPPGGEGGAPGGESFGAGFGGGFGEPKPEETPPETPPEMPPEAPELPPVEEKPATTEELAEAGVPPPETPPEAPAPEAPAPETPV